ncbi:MAG: helix-turn-helix domain-containing protein [Deltaproteobacteria bacterium]|nr:helix-turn-helix domain-containing protein [Deltaproteobacteria bacterium]
MRKGKTKHSTKKLNFNSFNKLSRRNKLRGSTAKIHHNKTDDTKLACNILENDRVPYLGRLLREERRINGITGNDLAKVLICDKGTVSKYESGEIPRSIKQWRHMIQIVPLIARYKGLSKIEKSTISVTDFIKKEKNEKNKKTDLLQLKLDRLTCVAEPSNRRTNFDSIKKQMAGNFSSDENYKTIVHIKEFDVHISCRPTDEKGQKKRKFIRVDFGSKALDSPLNIRNVFKIFICPYVKKKNIWLTRVDLAIDYPLDIAAFYFDKFFGRYTWKSWVGRGKNLYMFFGGDKSELKCKIYDKAHERRNAGKIPSSFILTRTEAMYQPRDAFKLVDITNKLKNVFEPFDIYKLSNISSLPVPQQYIAMLVEIFGRNAIEKMTSNKDWRKFVKVLQANTTISNFPGPEIIFMHQWHKLANRFLSDAGLRKNKRS